GARDDYVARRLEAVAALDGAIPRLRYESDHGVRRCRALGDPFRLDDQVPRRRAAPVGARARVRAPARVVARSAIGVADLLVRVRGAVVLSAPRAASPPNCVEDLESRETAGRSRSHGL